MGKDTIWFNTTQVAFILNVSDRTIRTRAKNHLNDFELVRLIGKSYELSDSFISLYRKLSEVIGNDEIEENEVVNEIKRELDKGNHIEVFTPENYALFEKTLKDYELKSLEIRNLDKTIVGLVQDKMFLQDQLVKTKDSLTQNQWILAKYLEAK